MTAPRDEAKRNDEFRVYGLYTVDENGNQRYFYVGMTGRSIPERVGEHRHGAYRRHEDVYKYLQQLDRDDINWTWAELRHCKGEHYWKDAERWEVIRLLKLGHDLLNMRYGNVARRAKLAQQVADVTIRSADDVVRARVTSFRARVVGRSIRQQRLRRKLLKSMLVESGIADVRQCELLGAALKRRLITDGCQSIQKGVTLKDVVCITWRSRRLATQAELLPPIAIGTTSLVHKMGSCATA